MTEMVGSLIQEQPQQDDARYRVYEGDPQGPHHEDLGAIRTGANWSIQQAQLTP